MVSISGIHTINYAMLNDLHDLTALNWFIGSSSTRNNRRWNASQRIFISCLVMVQWALQKNISLGFLHTCFSHGRWETHRFCTSYRLTMESTEWLFLWVIEYGEKNLWKFCNHLREFWSIKSTILAFDNGEKTVYSKCRQLSAHHKCIFCEN